MKKVLLFIFFVFLQHAMYSQENLTTTDISNIFVVDKEGNGDFLSLTECVSNAIKKPNSYVIVKNGTYDIIDEYERLYGGDFFEKYKSSDTNNGILLRNGIHLIFCDSAIVKCNYSGNNRDVMETFSMFCAPAWEGFKSVSFTIEGLKAEASNIRYISHDEMATNPNFYEHIYKNCNMCLDNTNSISSVKYYQCIGGGLGVNGKILITGCSFKSEHSVDEKLGIVSYHNSVSPEAKSELFLMGNKFYDYGTFRLSSYGTSKNVTTAIVCANELGSDIIERPESSEYSSQNTKVISWANSIAPSESSNITPPHCIKVGNTNVV